MKFNIHFKTPDTVDYALEDESLLNAVLNEKLGLGWEDKPELKEHADEVKEEFCAQMRRELEAWIKYREEVTLQYDTEEKQLTVKRC